MAMTDNSITTELEDIEFLAEDIIQKLIIGGCQKEDICKIAENILKNVYAAQKKLEKK